VTSFCAVEPGSFPLRQDGRPNEPNLNVAWPTAEISVMGPDGVVNILFPRQMEAADEKEGRGPPPTIAIVRDQINAHVAAEWSFMDDLINSRRHAVDDDPRGRARRRWRRWIAPSVNAGYHPLEGNQFMSPLDTIARLRPNDSTGVA
jgi:hypothetical protein